MSADVVGPTVRPMPTFSAPPPLQNHGPARMIAMCNQKGGVGKTTTTINLGAALADYGRGCCSSTSTRRERCRSAWASTRYELDRTVYNLLMERGVDAQDVVLKTNIAGHRSAPQQHRPVGGRGAAGRRGRPRADAWPGPSGRWCADYDLVLIDCQPSLGLLTVNALTACDGVIVPLECEFFALRGVALLVETIEKVKERLNPRLEIEGILATMYDARTIHGREVMARVLEAFGDRVFHTVITRTVRFPETTVAGEPITSYAPMSTGAVAYRQLAREVLAS